MLASNGTYSPTVLRGRTHWPKLGGEAFQPGVYRLVHVQDGVHQIVVDGTAHTIPPDTLYLLQPGAREAYTSTPASESAMIAFTVTPCELRGHALHRALDPVAADHVQPGPREIWGVDLPLVIDPVITPRLVDLLQTIVAMWWRDAWQHYRANMRLAELLEVLVEHEHRLDAPQPPDPPDDLLARVTRLIDDRLATLHQTPDLANALGLSTSHFNRLFKQATGETPAVHLRRRRLDAAVDLVRTTDWSMGRIAKHLGYRSAAAFNQTWRTRFSEPPLRWRRDRH